MRTHPFYMIKKAEHGVSLAQRFALYFLVVVSVSSWSLDHVTANGNRSVKIVVLGDSLSAGEGLSANSEFPAQLEHALKRKGFAVSVSNAGVSGDTAADGLARLESSIPDGTDGMIIELGANDANQGIEPNLTRAALDTIIRRLKSRHIEVLLAGMRASPEAAPPFAHAFNAIYPALARTHSIILHPFLLSGVTGKAGYIQDDGEHPNADGVRVIVASILPRVEELIARVRAGRRP